LWDVMPRRHAEEDPVGDRNIDLSGIVADPAWTTITKTRVISGRQQIVRIDEEFIDPIARETRTRLIDAACRAVGRADVLICSDYAKGVLCDDVLEAVIGHARQLGVPVIVDPKRKDFAAYRGATLVTPNRGEIAVATGMSLGSDADIERAAREISGQFGGDVLVTRSEEGMTLVRRDGRVTHAARANPRSMTSRVRAIPWWRRSRACCRRARTWKPRS
jgi:D-beta-D-heptose 7-phosphate kinase/D-beta-D-heptose 1-phosphate adenosyltransferase